MKYIEAEKLKAVLEARIEAGLDGYGGNLKWLLEILDSLQQDSILAEFMEKASEIGEKYNYGFGPNLSSLQQEQSEVDIEKEIEEYLINNSDFLVEQDSKAVVQALARHFYELGLNTRKEK